MSTFRVLGHTQISGRGAFVMGRIEDGTVRVGDRTETEPEFTVAAVEFADNVPSGESWVALRFAENPKKSTLERQLPVGSAVTVRAN